MKFFATLLLALLPTSVLTAQNLPILKARVGQPVLQELMGGCSLKCAFPWEVEVAPAGGAAACSVFATNDDDATTAWIDDGSTSIGTKLIGNSRSVSRNKIPGRRHHGTCLARRALK